MVSRVQFRCCIKRFVAIIPFASFHSGYKMLGDCIVDMCHIPGSSLQIASRSLGNMPQLGAGSHISLMEAKRLWSQLSLIVVYWGAKHH